MGLVRKSYHAVIYNGVQLKIQLYMHQYGLSPTLQYTCIHIGAFFHIWYLDNQHIIIASTESKEAINLSQTYRCNSEHIPSTGMSLMNCCSSRFFGCSDPSACNRYCTNT